MFRGRAENNVRVTWKRRQFLLTLIICSQQSFKEARSNSFGLILVLLIFHLLGILGYVIPYFIPYDVAKERNVPKFNPQY